MAKSTESMNPAVKCITMTVCSRVLYCSYYAASPAINLSLLISNKSSLWWASQMVEIWSLQHHTCREDSNTRIFPSFIPSLLIFLGDMVRPRTHEAYFAPTWSELEFITHWVSRPQLSGLDKDTGFEGLTRFAVWQTLHLYDFWMPFVPDSLLESRIFKWTETRCAMCYPK